MKQLTMIKVVAELQAQGHTIDYYVRTDGGILIKSIDGKKYTGASGNAIAREMAGASISQARIKQLKHITEKREKARKRRKPPVPLSKTIQTEFERVRKIWNKRFKAKEGKPHPAGYFDKSRIQYSLEHYGEEEALRRISEAERYATGYAYTKNIEILAGFIREAGVMHQSEELIQLADDILANGYSIEEDWIYPAYEKLYLLNKGGIPRQIAKDVRTILRL